MPEFASATAGRGDQAPMLAASQQSPQPSPSARRLARPRWRDPRLLVGTLLVLVSVVVGARVVASADHTSPFVVLKTSKSQDAVLTAADVEVRNLRLDAATAGRYYAGSALPSLVGMTLVRPVSAGELLAKDALAERTEHPQMSRPTLQVKSGTVEPLQPGDHVKVYLAEGSGADQKVVLVASGVQVTSFREGSTVTSVTVEARPQDSIALAAAALSERVVVVKTTPDSLGHYSDAGPTSVPGYGQ